MIFENSWYVVAKYDAIICSNQANLGQGCQRTTPDKKLQLRTMNKSQIVSKVKTFGILNQHGRPRRISELSMISSRTRK